MAAATRKRRRRSRSGPPRATPTCKKCGQQHPNFLQVCPPVPESVSAEPVKQSGPLLVVHQPREGWRDRADQYGDTYVRTGGSTFGVRGRKDSDYWTNPPPERSK